MDFLNKYYLIPLSIPDGKIWKKWKRSMSITLTIRYSTKMLSSHRLVSRLRYGSSILNRNFANNTISSTIPVKAYYIDNKIEMAKVHNSYSPCWLDVQKKLTTITIDEAKMQYISVFKYGSVVFFNISESEHIKHISKIRNDITDDRKVALQHTEEFNVINTYIFMRFLSFM
jgi:uncharacterized Rmd1/YagE family protein